LAGGEGMNLLRGNVGRVGGPSWESDADISRGRGKAAGVPNPSVGGLDGRVGHFGPILGALFLGLEGQSASLTDGRTAANSWAPQDHQAPHPSRPEASGPPGRIGHPLP